MPASGAPRRHRSRLPIVLLLIATLGVGTYFLLGRKNSSGASKPTGFVATSQNFITSGQNLMEAAKQVQRFLELHNFDNQALKSIVEMQVDLNQFATIAQQSSGTQRQLAEAQVTTAKQAITAATQFRQAVAFSYKLSNANTARQTLGVALGAIEHNLTAWNRT